MWYHIVKRVEKGNVEKKYTQRQIQERSGRESGKRKNILVGKWKMGQKSGNEYARCMQEGRWKFRDKEKEHGKKESKAVSELTADERKAQKIKIKCIKKRKIDVDKQW